MRPFDTAQKTSLVRLPLMAGAVMWPDATGLAPSWPINGSTAMASAPRATPPSAHTHEAIRRPGRAAVFAVSDGRDGDDEFGRIFFFECFTAQSFMDNTDERCRNACAQVDLRKWQRGLIHGLA